MCAYVSIYESSDVLYFFTIEKKNGKFFTRRGFGIQLDRVSTYLIYKHSKFILKSLPSILFFF